MADSLVFEDDPVVEMEWPVRVRKTDYILRRAMGHVAERYKSAQGVGIEYDPLTSKPKRVTNVGSLDSLLLSMVMFSAPNGDGRSSPVSRETILSWEPRTIEKLASFAREKSGLNTPDTIESLTKEKEIIERKLADLRTNPDPLASGSSDTMAGSD